MATTVAPSAGGDPTPLAGAWGRVLLRTVRRHVRPPEREARSGGASRRPGHRGAGFAGFAAGEIGQVPSDPDIAAIPDLRSFTPVPWEPTLARFACDITVEGEEWPYDPRTILRRQLEKARTAGYEFMMGLELEYFLLRSDATTAGSRSPTRSTRWRSPATTSRA